jgi:hypothetical protein
VVVVERSQSFNQQEENLKRRERKTAENFFPSFIESLIECSLKQAKHKQWYNRKFDRMTSAILRQIENESERGDGENGFPVRSRSARVTNNIFRYRIWLAHDVDFAFFNPVQEREWKKCF